MKHLQSGLLDANLVNNRNMTFFHTLAEGLAINANQGGDFLRRLVPLIANGLVTHVPTNVAGCHTVWFVHK